MGKGSHQLKEVWSSKEGVVGSIHSYSTSLSNITRIIAYSDGLEPVEKQIKPDMVVAQVEDLVKKAQSIKDDDVSFLEMYVPQSGALDFMDDMSSVLREHYKVQASHIEQEPLEHERYTTVKEYNELKKRYNKYKQYLIIAIVLLAILLLSLGLFIVIMWLSPNSGIYIN